MEIEIKDVKKDLVQIKRDMALIKNILILEGELSDWAKDELAKARAEKKEEYVSLEEL